MLFHIRSCFLSGRKNSGRGVVLRVCVYVCLCCAVLSAGGHVSVAWPGVSRGDRRCAGRRACAHRPTHGGVYKGRPADLRSVWDLGPDSTDLPSPTSAPGARHPSAPPSQASALGACRFYPSLGASALGACRSCPSLGGRVVRRARALYS